MLTLLRLPCIFWLEQCIITEHTLPCHFFFPLLFVASEVLALECESLSLIYLDDIFITAL